MTYRSFTQENCHLYIPAFSHFTGTILLWSLISAYCCLHIEPRFSQISVVSTTLHRDAGKHDQHGHIMEPSEVE